ncbi:MAG: hypothetical protein E7369_06140 [Clostridiales bacterium]|nr:hypothetical protein [Clostridiales bacterium]
MKKYIRKIGIICLAFAMCVLTLTLPINNLNTDEAYASTVSEAYVEEDFDSSAISQASWISHGAKLHNKYYAMRFTDLYQWSTHIVLQDYFIDSSVDIYFSLRNVENRGWFGVTFGNDTATVSFDANAEHLLVFYPTESALMSKGASGLLHSSTLKGTENELTPFTFSKGNDVAQVKLSLIKVGDNDYTLTYYCGEYGGELFEGGRYENLELKGMISFCGMENFCGEVSDLRIEKEGTTVYENDFSDTSVAYPNDSVAGKSFVITSTYNSSNVYCGAINDVELTDGDLECKERISHNNITAKQFLINYDLVVGELQKNSYVGVYFDYNGKRNFVGVGKTGNQLSAVSIVNGNFNQAQNLYSSDLSTNKILSISLCGYYDQGVSLTIGGKTLELGKVPYEGVFALGVYGQGTTFKTTAYVDNFEFIRYDYKYSDTKSISNDFSGTKEIEDGEFVFKEYYINRTKYYLGMNVTIPKYSGSTPREYIIFANSQETSYFAPKQVYGDYILRFDVQVTDEYTYENRYDQDTGKVKQEKSSALIGVSFGKEFIGENVKEADGIFFYNWYNPLYDDEKDVSYSREPESNRYHDTWFAVANPQIGKFDHFDTCPYDIWSDKTATYNVMMVAQNNTVKLYMKKSTESSEKFMTPVYVMQNVNTYGYVAIMGQNGASFKLSNYSLTNISPLMGGAL